MSGRIPGPGVTVEVGGGGGSTLQVGFSLLAGMERNIEQDEARSSADLRIRKSQVS